MLNVRYQKNIIAEVEIIGDRIKVTKSLLAKALVYVVYEQVKNISIKILLNELKLASFKFYKILIG